MRPLLRPVEMAEADRLTIEAGTPGQVLMDRAGRAVARAVVDVAGGRYGVNVLILCGKGNNGGDGFVAARLLDSWGLKVDCATLFDPAEARGDAAHHLEQLRSSGIEPARLSGPIDVDRYDVVVDAIFGTGFKGRVEGDAADVIASLSGHECVISVDIPSGVDGLTGAVSGPAVYADLTVAMGAEKTGTALPPGSVHAGVVQVADIGIDVDVRKFERAGTGVMVESFVEMAEAADIAQSLPERSPGSHKRGNGSVAVLAGSDAYPGAAVLTCAGAARSGAGYVTLATTGKAATSAIAWSPELVVKGVTGGATLEADALESVAEILERSDAIAAGPGWGTDEGLTQLLRGLLARETPLVLDADGLNVLARDPSVLSARSAATILTPHPGELARLLDVEPRSVTSDRLGAALELSSRFPRAIVVAKGHRTVVSYGGGKVAVVIPVGGPELATAGTGDVLTGVIASLVAQGVPPVGAAITGAYVHGIAGSVAGQRVGPTGVGALDVAEAIPEAVALIRATPV